MIRPIRYILVDKTPVVLDDLMMWANWMEESMTNESRVVKQDQINDLWISTVFLGIDHAFTGPPMLFETLVFWLYEKPVTKIIMGKEFTHDKESISGTMRRYSTWSQAEKGHTEVVKETRKHFMKVG
jgi:hypothetical protein